MDGSPKTFDTRAQRSRCLVAAVGLALVAASCGGGGSSSSTDTSPGAPTDQQRASAASLTVATNPKCSVATLGSYYWEIGDASGVKVAGTVGAGAPTAATSMWVFSSSKWLYAASVLQKHGVQDSDVPFLNFTSGYSKYGNPPICQDASTVDTCFVGHDGTQDPTTIDRFAYDSGHMQQHASAIMNMGPFSDTDLANDLNSTLGGPAFAYNLPQLAAGVQATPRDYAAFLRRLLRGELNMAGALGSHKVCAQSQAPGCNAAFTPDSIGSEAWNYSLGHWVEDDPALGDHAFSSAGGGGFYPWIDAGKTYYGLVARERETESAAGYHSAECGRLVRQAWMTGKTVTSTAPTP